MYKYVIEMLPTTASQRAVEMAVMSVMSNLRNLTNNTDGNDTDGGSGKDDTKMHMRGLTYRRERPLIRLEPVSWHGRGSDAVSGC